MTAIGLRYKQEEGSMFKICKEKDQCLNIQREGSMFKICTREGAWFKIYMEKDLGLRYTRRRIKV